MPNLISTHLGRYESAVQETLSALNENNIIGRIWDHDHTVWRPDPEEITNRLGWLHLPWTMPETFDQISALIESVKNDGYTNALLLGMGGSSLAPEVFSKTFGPASDGLHLEILDSTHPDTILAYADRLNYAHTLFIVSTKSGGTVETLSFFKYFYNQVAETLGEDQAGRHFVAITDPGSKLEKLAGQYNFRETFLNNPNIGGRYSVLSFFGLVPAALIGIDINLLLKRAAAPKNAAGNKGGALLGAVLGVCAKNGRDKLTLITSPAITSFGDWVEQLIAESTGKEGQGILPVVAEPLGQPGDYGDDRLFVHLHLAGTETDTAALDALTAAGHPLVEIELTDLYDLGAQFFLWEMATAVAGHVLDIQPFDQPNVESAKKRATAMVNAYQEEGELPTSAPETLTGDTLNAFLDQANPGDYIAIQAYVQPTAEMDDALQQLRLDLREKTKLAISIGFGPRFLHSTGQLHKGDSGNGLFIQFTSDGSETVPIPETAGKDDSSITFNVLVMAQALGDGQALQDEDRRVIHFHLGDKPLSAVKSV